jgi:UDP-N-acetylmuramoyl-tripeptide--D-alanyl-D-alanine ligase
MISLTLGEIAGIAGGRLYTPSGDVDSALMLSGLVDTDSREIGCGDIFIAKPGEVTDGWNFIGSARDAGAALVITERESDVDIPQIIVADAVVALADLAREVVARVRLGGALTVIGITGSNGKTTTKNLIGALCQRLGPTVLAKASFNNEVGAPLTMLRVQSDTRYLVLELGASGIGHISRLTDIVALDIGVVLMVGLAHAGEFGGFERTVMAKTELVRGILPGGTAVLNADDPNVASMARVSPDDVVWFGRGATAQVRATDVDTHLSGTTFELRAADGSASPAVFPVIGEHHVMNALAMAAVAGVLGAPLSVVVDVLAATSRAERWRMEVLGGEGVVVINDAYNASPDSMSAALRTLARLGDSSNRRIAVLGEMSELGEFSGEEHDAIALLVVRLNVDVLVVVGAGARRLFISSINEGSWAGESVFFETSDEAYDYLMTILRDNDIVLVKSSNSAGLRFLGDKLGEAFAC